MSNKDNHEAAVVKRVSRKHDGDEHGGAWKVAFADFCLALMCLFLVLWVLAARNQEQLEELMRTPGGNIASEGGDKVLDSVANQSGSLIPREPIPGEARATNGTPGKRSVGHADVDDGLHLSKAKMETPDDMRELAGVLAKLSESAGLTHNVQAVVTPYGLRVMLHDTDKQGMFQRGSAVPSDRFRDLLHKMGPLFGQITNPLLIVGHTDAAPYVGAGFGGFSNWGLSSNRAMVARANLLEGGMPQDRVLQVVGMAERAPLNASDPLAAQNRRIELLVLTTGQAKLITAMFGTPGNVQTAVPGVDTAVPDTAAISAVQLQLEQGGNHAHP